MELPIYFGNNEDAPTYDYYVNSLKVYMYHEEEKKLKSN